MRVRALARTRVPLITVFLALGAVVYLSLASYMGTLRPLAIVEGTSMEPSLRSGDLVLLKSVSPGEIDFNDVILFNVPSTGFGADVGTPVLHRVIQRGVVNDQLELVTKGDNAIVDPITIPEDAVRGKLISRIPYAGLALGLLPIASLVILAIAAPVFLGRYLLKRVALPE
jgi:signal peptidase